MQEKEVFLKEDIVWAFDTFLGQLKSSEAIYPQTIRAVEHLKKQIVEIVPTHEVGSNWHTGTPTEEGWYLQRIKSKNKISYDTDYYENGDWKYSCVFREIVAWQKIEEGEEVNG